jgi:hypothetical protein
MEVIMKYITLSLLLFSFVIAPITAGESGSGSGYEGSKQSFFMRYKKPLIAVTALSAAGAAWVYAGKPGYDDASEMLGYMSCSNTASRATDAMSGAYNTGLDYAMRAWNSPFAYALGDVSDVLQNKLITYSQRVWHSSAFQAMREKADGVYQSMSAHDEDIAIVADESTQNNAITEAMQQVQERCPRELSFLSQSNIQNQ